MVGSCKDVSTVDCFAQYKRGFCVWYATTMAIFLRAQGIPARVAEGYMPGIRVPGQEWIRGDSRHQWVEAYFPYYGWVMFDPTGGESLQQPLPPGPAGASTRRSRRPRSPSRASATRGTRSPSDPEPAPRRSSEAALASAGAITGGAAVESLLRPTCFGHPVTERTAGQAGSGSPAVTSGSPAVVRVAGRTI